MGDWVLVKKPLRYKSKYKFKSAKHSFLLLYNVTELS